MLDLGGRGGRGKKVMQDADFIIHDKHKKAGKAGGRKGGGREGGREGSYRGVIGEPVDAADALVGPGCSGGVVGQSVFA